MYEQRPFFNVPNFWGLFPGQNISSGGQQTYPTHGTTQDSGPPMTPPPPFTPEPPQIQTFAIDPGAIRGCLYRFTYVFLERGGFWFYPVFVGRRSVSGYRWLGYRWVYVGIDLNQIQSFQCY